MTFVDRGIFRKERLFGKAKSRHGLTRYVHEPNYPKANSRFENVKRRHQIVAKHDVRRVVQRVGDRGGVHDGFGTTYDSECFASIGEIGHLISSRSLRLRIESRSRQIRREYLVTCVNERLGRSAAHLAVGTCDDYLHDLSSSTRKHVQTTNDSRTR